ncbi:CopG family ribbon-helix-helix protein [Flavisphingomonas formosensis]|uniref:CopG family ribbon-helix-helix protein n=1 Tax=Flavisphingomonas formosensis TaxID=861534 RepID=UPI0012FBEA7F|nr:ribbon-helix-helix protein, CopG family [Sphingomonas formosensis]
MSKTAVITARLDVDTLALVDRIAGAHGRSRAWFAARAIRHAAEQEAELLEFLQKGIDAAESGDLIDHDAVFREIRARRTE